jgi:hypothetical protein
VPGIDDESGPIETSRRRLEKSVREHRGSVLRRESDGFTPRASGHYRHVERIELAREKQRVVADVANVIGANDAARLRHSRAIAARSHGDRPAACRERGRQSEHERGFVRAAERRAADTDDANPSG